MKEKINLTIDSSIKQKANDIFKQNGISASAAFEQYCREIIRNGYTFNEIPTWLEKNLVAVLQRTVHWQLNQWQTESNDNPLQLNIASKLFEIYLLHLYQSTMKLPDAVLQDIIGLSEDSVMRQELFDDFASRLEVSSNKYLTWIKSISDEENIDSLSHSSSYIDNEMASVLRSLSAIYTKDNFSETCELIKRLTQKDQQKVNDTINELANYSEKH